MVIDPQAQAWTKGERSALAAVVIALVVTVLRIVYLRWVCDYQLVEDEAHYWMWSKYLDWSYYSKGPGVAWAIALSTRVFGDAEWAVRLPTAVLSGVGLCFVGLLGRDVAIFGSEKSGGVGVGVGDVTPRRVAVMSVLAVVLVPAIQMVGILMTIDGGYVACWAGASWCAWRALMMRSRSAWLGLGVCIAVGFLFKYTMLLVVPGIGLCVWWMRGGMNVGKGWRWWAVVGTAIAMLGLVPVVVWNSQHEWATVRHLIGHLGMAGGDVPMHAVPGGGATPRSEWSPWWSLELVGQQLGMIGPLLVLGALAGARVIRRRSERELSGRIFLVACALPILAFYLIVSFITEPEGNWPMAGYVTLLPLGAWWAAEVLDTRKRAKARGERPGRKDGWPRWLWRGGLWYGVVAMLLLHFAGDIAASLNRLSGDAWFASTFERVIGRSPREVVVGRLYGAREMAGEVDGLLEGLYNEERKVPFILTQHYGRASQMAYYLPVRFRKCEWDLPFNGTDSRVMCGTPFLEPPSMRSQVLCAMKETGGRRSQFDVWPHTSLSRPDLIGRSAVILSNDKPETMAVWRAMFERVKPAPVPGGRLMGEHKADRVAFIGHGYRGVGNLAGMNQADGAGNEAMKTNVDNKDSARSIGEVP